MSSLRARRRIAKSLPVRTAGACAPGWPSAARSAAALLIFAFLSAALAPCPLAAPVPIARASNAHECHETGSSTFLSAPCPCGCETKAPAAGISARLGAVLLSCAPDLAPRRAAALAAPAEPRLAGSFASPIDHIPLPV